MEGHVNFSEHTDPNAHAQMQSYLDLVDMFYSLGMSTSGSYNFEQENIPRKLVDTVCWEEWKFISTSPTVSGKNNLRWGSVMQPKAT